MSTKRSAPIAPLPYSAHLIHGPIAKDGLAVNIALIHRTEVPAVVRHRAMIAQNEIAFRRHDRLRIGPRVGVSGWNVVLIQRLAIHINLPAVDSDTVPGSTNHALDIALRGIARITEHYDIPARNRLQAVHEFVDEDSLLIFE